MQRVLRAFAILQRSSTSRVETGESREVDIEVERGTVAIVLRDANALTAGTKGDLTTGGGEVVGPFHRLELREADLRQVLGVDD